MRVGIGGGRESKWSITQKVEARIWIRKLLKSYQSGFSPINTLKYKGDCYTGKSGVIVKLGKDEDLILVSGHCHLGGIDIWAEEIAKELGIEIELHPAGVHQWNDFVIPDPYHVKLIGKKKRRKGYKSRNIDMAESCNVWYAIEAARSCKRCRGYSNKTSLICPKCEGDGAYGGATWTGKYVRKLGKPFHKIVIK